MQELQWVDRFIEKLTIRSVLVSLIVLLGLIAWNRGIAFLYAINALLVATLFFSWLLPRNSLRGVGIRRVVGKEAYEGDEIALTYTLAKPAFFNRYLIEIEDTLSFLSPAKVLFLVPKLSSALTLQYKLRCEVRGVHGLHAVTLRSGFPLNVFVREKQFEQPKQYLIVYPKAFEVHQFRMQADATNRRYGMHAIEKKGGNDEFIGVREYRHGDTLRTIHWGASAKRREWIVKEFEDVSTQSLTILLDLQQGFDVGEGKHSTFEYTVKIAVSLALYALENKIALNIFGYGQNKLELLNIQGIHNVQTILETFAYVKCNGSKSYRSVVEHFLAQHRHGGTLVLFENNHGARRLLSELNRRHCAAALFSFDKESFGRQPDFKAVATVSNRRNQKIYTIKNGCDLAEMFQ